MEIRSLRCLGWSLAAGVALLGRSDAQTCPPTPNQVSVGVSASVSYDARSGLYDYSYTVTNSGVSAQEVNRFGVDFAPPASNVLSPDGWVGSLMSRRSSILWSALRVADPLLVTNDGSLPPSIVQIKRGASLGGFSFKSPSPPGPRTYYATGYVAAATVTGRDEADAEAAAEKLVESCPQFGGTFIDQAVTGTTVGPVNALGVRVRMRSRCSPTRFNPNAHGTVHVAILGSSSVSAAALDAASVRLGPGRAAPRGPGRAEDVNDDGFQDLVLEFAAQEMDVQCGDRVVLLSGTTTTGAAIAGFDAIRTVECGRDAAPEPDRSASHPRSQRKERHPRSPVTEGHCDERLERHEARPWGHEAEVPAPGESDERASSPSPARPHADVGARSERADRSEAERRQDRETR